jgi:hypothetical protein
MARFDWKENLMTTSRRITLLSIFAFALALAGGAFLIACAPTTARVTVRVTLEPTTPPPTVRVAVVTCAGTHYYQPGRHHWLRGRYVFRKGRCVRRPASWHAGCSFFRGRWIRRGRKYEYRPGSTLCRTVTTVSLPIALPPPLRPPAHRCSPGQYLQRGHWQWVRGKWAWRPGRCLPRPKQWAAQGCRYVSATWRRAGKRLLYTKGGIVCRSRPGSRVHARRCTAAMRKAGRCGRVPKVLRPCRRNYYRHRGKCVRRGVRRCTRAMRKAGRCR